MSRLSIEISSEQHQKIKALAALQGKSIKDLILDKLINPNAVDEQRDWNKLEELLLFRIENAQVSPKSLKEITDDVLKS
ncbi:antitoxin [Flavobacteriaceae bacterium 14752]|uniref:antitoxin n=1 Tax=Mesohalobacter salilacus TaxID=2491711 RepID=UPI000F644866|nr:antitoxin [Flavobacteriaceae bacterium 14752]